MSADVIELGKFDRPGHLRLRGFYTAAGLTVRVQPAKLTDPERDGIARCVAAARLIGAHRPDLMPRMLDHGTVARGRLGYLVEEAVAGTTPRGPRQVSAAMVRVATELFAIQQAIGIDSRRLSALAEPEFPARWRSVVAHGHVRDALGAQVERLIARDAMLEVSFTHGDLVSSNVLDTPRGPVLIDWEYAGEQPIVFDLAKMHVNAGAAGAAAERLAGVWGPAIGQRPDHYSVLEQLALAHAVVLSRHEARAMRAQQAGRNAPLTRQTRRRAHALEELLSLAAGAREPKQ